MGKSEDIVVNCFTEKSWDEVQDKAFEDGFVWSGDSAVRKANKWPKYGETSCIHLDFDYNKLTYSPKSFYEEDGYKIITAEEYLKEKGGSMDKKELEGMSVTDLRTKARNETDAKGTWIVAARKDILVKLLMGGEIVKEDQQEPLPMDVKPTPKGDGADQLADMFRQMMGGGKGPELDMEQVKKLIAGEVKKLSIPKQIEIKMLGAEDFKPMGLQHYLFEEVLKLAQLRCNSMLVGPAGSGKTTMAHSVADALDLPFSFISVGQQTTKTDLLGYMDATGKYVSTHLRKAYEHGGVFLLDEIDAGNANVITILNAMLANGSAAFPDEMISRHDDFIFLCAANTYGKGSDRQYIGRNQLDAATLDRFVVLDFDYDEALELAIGSDDNWTKHVQALRKAANDLKEQIVISPRASVEGGKLIKNGWDKKKVENMVVFKGANKDVESRIRGAIKG